MARQEGLRLQSSDYLTNRCREQRITAGINLLFRLRHVGGGYASLAQSAGDAMKMGKEKDLACPSLDGPRRDRDDLRLGHGPDKASAHPASLICEEGEGGGPW